MLVTIEAGIQSGDGRRPKYRITTNQTMFRNFRGPGNRHQINFYETLKINPPSAAVWRAMLAHPKPQIRVAR